MKIWNKKHLEQAISWFPTVLFFGAGTVALGVYFTEWRSVLENIPLYGSKYKNMKKPEEIENDDDRKLARFY